ncbi:hypothetical protein COL154_014007, partial [Colletotrichum chrysophilum]
QPARERRGGMGVGRRVLKSLGRDDLPGGCTQAAECFDPDDLTGVETHDRLIERIDPLIGQCRRDVVDRLAAVSDTGTDAGPIANEATPPRLLGVIECEIGILVDPVGVISGFENRSADRRTRHDDISVTIRRLSQNLEDPDCSFVQVGKRLMALDDDGEFVTSDPEDDIGRHGHRNPSASGFDQGIACLMPERVVHRLQVVQIDDEHTPLAGFVTGDAAERRLEGSPVRQSGQRVDIQPPLVSAHPRITLKGKPAKVETDRHGLAFVRLRPAHLIIIKCDNTADSAIVGTDRR